MCNVDVIVARECSSPMEKSLCHFGRADVVAKKSRGVKQHTRTGRRFLFIQKKQREIYSIRYINFPVIFFCGGEWRLRL